MYITEEHNGFAVRFTNPITGGTQYVKRFPKIEEAEKCLSEAEISFFKEHSYLLPKGVTIDQNFFVLCITIPHYNKMKRTHLGTFKLLSQVKERKLEIISKLID